jgi:hypothetical protein
MILNTPPTPTHRTVYQKDITAAPDISRSKSLRQINARNKLRLIAGWEFRETEMESEIWLGKTLWFRIEDDWMDSPHPYVQDLYDKDPKACRNALDYLLEEPSDQKFWKGKRLRIPVAEVRELGEEN